MLIRLKILYGLLLFPYLFIDFIQINWKDLLDRPPSLIRNQIIIATNKEKHKFEI